MKKKSEKVYMLPGFTNVTEEQNLCCRTPLRRLENIENQLCRMGLGSGEMIYVFIFKTTYPWDFHGMVFMIF